jgi:hypothetical protein
MKKKNAWRSSAGFVSAAIMMLAIVLSVAGCDRRSDPADTLVASDPPDGDTGMMRFGRFAGQVRHDEAEGLYYLELRGARFPFRSSPLRAQHVALDAPGEGPLEKNTALIYGILGEEVRHVTLLVDPDEEDEVMPAANDLATAVRMVNARKFAGLAYTKPGGKLEHPVLKGPRIQNLEDATAATPIIRLRGPGGGAEATRVRVDGRGQVLVEGRTYEDLEMAADFIYLTLLKMLCGSPECPDAASCLSGGDCGCGGR